MAVTFVNQPVSVHLLIDAERQTVAPVRIKWQGKTYVVREVGMHHADRRGIRKIHVFTVNVGSLDMRIEIDSDTLAATLIATSDGLAD